MWLEWSGEEEMGRRLGRYPSGGPAEAILGLCFHADKTGNGGFREVG